MSHNFSLKYNSKDITIGCISVILIVALVITSNFYMAQYNSGNLVVNVYISYKLHDEYSLEWSKLEENKNYEIVLKKEQYDVLLDDMLILVNKKKGIKVEEETSPRKICSSQGWVNSPGVPLICLPNQVYIVIESSSIDNPIPIG
jgi:hypothetical protein